MALIKCIECGGRFSEMATTCPHCGAPVDKIRYSSTLFSKLESERNIKNMNKQKRINLIIFIAKLFWSLFFLYAYCLINGVLQATPEPSDPSLYLYAFIMFIWGTGAAFKSAWSYTTRIIPFTLVAILVLIVLFFAIIGLLTPIYGARSMVQNLINIREAHRESIDEKIYVSQLNI